MRHAKDQHHNQQQIEALLDRVIDPQTKRSISVKYIQKKTLVLGASSSAALYNINLKKEELLQAVKQIMPSIENINIKV